MADRRAEKERLRQERLGRQEEEARRARIRVLVGYVAAGILGAGIVVGILVAVLGSGDGPSPAAADAAFGTHFAGLEARRLRAGVPTMAEGGGSHFHPQIRVFVNGKQITVPANIGIDPALPPTSMAGLHTHDTSGTIHNEAGSGATLGDFIAVWGVPFSSERLGPYRARGGKAVRMWVDGEPSRAFGGLKLADGQQIVVAFGTEEQVPKGMSGVR